MRSPVIPGLVWTMWAVIRPLAYSGYASMPGAQAYWPGQLLPSGYFSDIFQIFFRYFSDIFSQLDGERATRWREICGGEIASGKRWRGQCRHVGYGRYVEAHHVPLARVRARCGYMFLTVSTSDWRMNLTQTLYTFLLPLSGADILLVNVSNSPLDHCLGRILDFIQNGIFIKSPEKLPDDLNVTLRCVLFLVYFRHLHYF